MAPPPTNFGVMNETSVVNYQIPKNLQKAAMSFNIEPAPNGQSQAMFQIKDKNGSVVIQNVSKPFPPGKLTVKSTKLKTGSYVVELKKAGDDVDLNEYFK